MKQGIHRVQPVPREIMPVPESSLGSLSATTGTGKDRVWESSICPSSSHKEPSVQLLFPTPFGSLVLQQFPESWASLRTGNASREQQGNPAAQRCHTHQAVTEPGHSGVPWILPSAEQLLWSTPSCRGRAAGPLLSAAMCLDWKLYTGWAQQTQLNSVWGQKKLFSRPLPLTGQCSLCPF